MARGFTVSFTAITVRRKIPPEAQLISQLAVHTYKYVKEVQDLTAEYPPEPSDRYQRTYTLRDSWKIEPVKSRGSIGYTLSNYARDPRGVYYSRLVHGPGNDQLNMHRLHGWRNITDVVKFVGGRDALRKGAQDIITKYLAGV